METRIFAAVLEAMGVFKPFDGWNSSEIEKQLLEAAKNLDVRFVTGLLRIAVIFLVMDERQHA